MADPGATHRADETPSAWVVRWRHLLRPGMNVLDLACGHGRHARYLAGCGCRVTAVDRDPDALASLAGNPAVEVMALDLEGGWWPFAGRQFDAIVVVRYLHRPLLPALLDSLASDGLLIYETFMRGNEVYGRPSNPDFLLAPDELLDWARPRLRTLAFEQGRSDGERPAVVQRICALGHEAPEGKLD